MKNLYYFNPSNSQMFNKKFFISNYKIILTKHNTCPR